MRPFFTIQSSTKLTWFLGVFALMLPRLLQAQLPGNCLQFDGANDQVVLPATLSQSISASSTDAVSIMYWFKGSKVQSAVRFQNGNSYVISGWGAAGSEKHILSNDGGSGAGIAVGAEATDGRWHHIAMTWKRNTTNGFKSYLDGKLVEQRNSSNNALPLINSVGYLGCFQGNSEFMNGALDEVKVYSVAKTQAEIQTEMFNSPASGFGAGILAYYKFNQGLAGGANAGVNSLPDATGGFNGSLVNFALSGTASNWVESYAGVRPISLAATSVNTNAFTANWQAPVNGIIDAYTLEVSGNPDFSTQVAGSPFTLPSNQFSRTISGLISGTYYYRVRASKNSLGYQGTNSEVISVTLPYDAPGNALAFDGSNDYVKLPDGILNGQKSITVEAWALVNSNSIWQRVVDLGSSSNTYLMISTRSTDDVPVAEVRFNGGTKERYLGLRSLELGKWYHFAFTLDSASKTGRFYINGELQEEKTNSEHWPSRLGLTTANFLGKSQFSVDPNLNGQVDEFRIWRKAKTAAEIKAEMDSLVNPNSADLLVYYRFDQGIQSANNFQHNQLFDLSLSGNHASLFNFAYSGSTSNYVESFALVYPRIAPPSGIQNNAFTVNWVAPKLDIVNGYFIDVSTNPDFTSQLPGYPFYVSGKTTFSKVIIGLQSNLNYYYRVRVEKATVSGKGSFTGTQAVRTLNSFSPPGNCLYFDGTNDGVSVAGMPMEHIGNFTMEAWINPATLSITNQTLFSYGFDNGSTGNGISLNIEPGGNLKILHSAVIHVNSGFVFPTANRWYHIAVTRSNGVTRVYVNGEQTATTVTSNPYTPSDFRIGSNNGFRFFNGRMDEFRFYKQALTAEQIKADMVDTASVLPEHLIAYYNFDQGIPSASNTGVNILTDVSGNNKNGSLLNFALSGTTSNWIRSNAMTLPVLLAPSGISPTGFTINWERPVFANASSYVLDVSSNPLFTGLLAGSPFTMDSTIFSKTLSGLIPGTYYYRVRSQTAGVQNQEAVSFTGSVFLDYKAPGNALSMDGNGDYVSIPASTGVNNRFGSSKVTFETWVLFKSLPNPGQMPALITENYNGSGGYNILFSIFLHQNKLYGGFHDGNWTAAICPSPFEVNKWYHVACTYDKTIIKLYVNGVLMATQTTTQTLPKGSEDWSIGKRWDYAEYINGVFDEVKIYNEALTEAQINLDMRDTGVVLPSNLVAYFNFDYGVSEANNSHLTTLPDLSSFGHNGKLMNFSMTGALSNFIESFAVAIPKALPASAMSTSGFTANWELAKTGEVDNYYLEVSSTSDFEGLISQSLLLPKTSTSYTLSNLNGGAYFYRVRANNSKTNLTQKGAYSNTIQANVGYIPPGNAISFDGVNDRLRSAGNAIGNFGNGEFTVEYWINTTDNAGYHITKRADCAGGIFWSLYSDQANIHVEINNGGSNNNSFLVPYNLNDGKWHHVALTRSGTVAKVYVDGKLEKTNTVGGIANVNNSGYLYLGGSVCNNPLLGSMDEVRLWSKARTEDEIKAGMTTLIPSGALNLVAYYDFDQGIGGLLNKEQTLIFEKSGTDANKHLLVQNMEMEGLNTNLVKSYAMIVPTLDEPSGITPNGFTLTWSTPAIGQDQISNYLVDISQSPTFAAPISGSPFSVAYGTNSLEVSGLASATFYCRVRANKSGSVLANTGAASNVKTVRLEYQQPGNALKFDGNNDYGTIPRKFTGDVTIEYWMKTTQTGPLDNFGVGLVDMEVPGAPGDIRHGLRGDKILVGVGSNDQDPNLFSISSVNTGKWTHVALTRQKSTGQVRIYINGNLEASGFSGTGNLTGANELRLGVTRTSPGSDTRSFDGALDELRIWNVVRTPAEIADAFMDTVDRATPGLVNYYRFDQGVSGANNAGVTTILDLLDPQNNGTLTNSALSGFNSNWVQAYNMTVNGVNNLTTTTDICSRIDLSWQLSSNQPSTNCDNTVQCDAQYFRQLVYADDELVAELPYTATAVSFNVNQIYNGKRLERGNNYKFKVVSAYMPILFKYVKYASPSNVSIGRFKPNPVAPSGFTASTAKCDGSVDLGWTWTDVNPGNGFVIDRGTDSSLMNKIQIFQSGDKRSFTDNGLQRGQFYAYRIFARNDCWIANAPDSMIAGQSDTLEIIMGISPSVPARVTNIRLFADSINNTITVRWNDNSSFEDKFTVERTAIGGGTSSFDVNANDTVYVDEMAAACTNYNYSVKVYSGCALNGINSQGINQTRLTPNLSNTFETGTIYKLRASKGYFPDRVELNWNNRNNGQLTSIRIYRKVANSPNDSILINSVLAGSGLYVDNTTIAGVLYRYYLIGETQCAGVTRYSNMASDIGFRSPSGVINGTITYQGGFAVEGARVFAQNTSSVKGGAIAFDGIDDYLEVPHKASQNPGTNALTIEAWYKPMQRNSFVLVSKFDTLNGGYYLRYDSLDNKLKFTVSNGLETQTVEVDTPITSFTSYNQFTVTYDKDSIRMYINGIEGKTEVSTLSSLGGTSLPITMGGDPTSGIYGEGNLDEVRLWRIAKNKEQITKDFNRTVGANNANLFLYYSFDDRFDGLTETYDQSNLNLVFKENHANLLNGASFTDSIPTSSQLALATYTDDKGSYLLENVRYNGKGQNFNVVPSLNIHTFSPNNRVVFIGDGNQVLNNIDFLDNSSFEFVGMVTYAGTTCPASGANVLIDGQLAVQNGMAVSVNDSGKFVVRVPIGNHAVSLVQEKHRFSEGRFPPSGLYNFLSPVSAQFKDSTYLKVVGRVVGGNLELNKVPGLGRSVNNIGKAQFSFNSVGQAGVLGCFTQPVITNDSSGEYIAYLLPLRYTINGLKLVNNPDPTLLTNANFNNPTILDLTTIPGDTTIVDTLKTASYSKVDSITYTKRLDFKYFTNPQIYLTALGVPFDSLVNNFIGEKELKINDSTTLTLLNNEFDYPVFQQATNYTGLVKVLEIYTNIDKPLTDPSRNSYVPVSGTLRFNNNLASSTDSVREVFIPNGMFTYTFLAGTPNHLRNSVNPQYSYTKTLQIDFVPEVGLTVSYNPRETDLVNRNYRGIIMGTRPGGASFTTKGPALVDFVLRDPPGSASSTTWSRETSYTTVKSYNFTKSFSQGLEGMWDFGQKTYNVAAPLGVGIMTETEVVNNLTLGLSTTQSMTGEGELVMSTTNTRTISTGGDPGSVGAGADIYFGTSRNMVFGTADQVELLDTQTCRLASIRVGTDICVGPVVNGYRIGKRTGFYISPTDIASTFAYTQDEIVNIVIPDLEELRNSYILNDIRNSRGQKKYTSVFSDESDPDFNRKFASNNDDPIWGGMRSTATPFDKELADSAGPSYIFRGETPYDTDSIRYFNDQIRLWKNAIARNEKAKYKAFSSNQPGIAGGKNISIGKAAFSEDFNTTQEETSTETFELSFGQEITWALGFESFLGGVEKTSPVSFEQTSGRSSSRTTSTSNTFSYTLQDGDDGDLISVDIINAGSGGSHLFKLRAGKTSCPYEGEVLSMFYDPDNDTITSTTLLEEGFEIQPATAQNDVPMINVQQKTIFNVPADDPAVFVLELGNLSEGHQDRTYSLRVDQASNPYGAIIKVDGLDPNRDFDVPYGTTIQKTLTIERGPINYDYNNIKLIFKSSCDDDIFDTVSISARFLPTCTGVTLKSPDDRWVLNTGFNDTLPVLIGGYNYNYGGFKAVHFQYKPASGNTWYTEKTFYRDTAVESMMIPIGTPDIFYPFNMRNLPDGKYELRAVTECIAPGYPNSRLSSTVLQGTVDRVNPSPFGNPSPADGILSPNDEISIKFNEAIDQSTLSFANFEVKGVLNKTTLRSNSSLYFDGEEDYAEVPVGLNLQRSPFTLEMWHKRGKLGAYVLASQGADSASSFEFGYTNDNRLYFKVGEEIVTSNQPLLDTTSFNFIAVAYNSESQVADLYLNNFVVNIGNNRIFNPFESSGKLYLGKAANGSPRYAKGNVYEMRLWSGYRTLVSANNTKSILLNGTEAGLIANWRMDEASGVELKDYARSRNATVVNAQWMMSPRGHAYGFAGNGFISVPTSTFGLSKEMDFTIEFWFKSNQGSNVCLLSNGKGDSSDANPNLKWSFETNSQGLIFLKHNNRNFQATNTSFFDGSWHHFAVVMKRSSSLSVYVDGNLQNSSQAINFEQFGGGKIWVGSRGWNNLALPVFDSTDMPFTGSIDELRIWQSSRLVEQIRRDKNNRLTGKESGLVLYIPFESYQEVMGFPVLNPSTSDMSSAGTRDFNSSGSNAFNQESPTIKLPRPVQDINFSYSVNNDQIIITPTTSNEFIENVTLDITVKGIKDLNGNTMQSPKTWIAYMDRNQVKWQDEYRNFSKQSQTPLSFVAKIVNSGGALKEYTLSNLPSWLKAAPSNGLISPNSSQEITLTVDPNLNIGKYEADLALNTDFGFADKLLVKLEVKGTAPTWDVNPALYTKSMSIIGQVRINNIISSNTDDILAAFVGEECRGKAKVTYYEQLDKYLVFMDVYGVAENEQMEFRIWNSATGKTHVDVLPALQFQTNVLVGNVLNPQVFNALDKVNQSIVVKPGWNWISFNLLTPDSNNLDKLFGSLNLQNGAILKNIDQLAVYDKIQGWSGNLANFSVGMKPEKSYLFFTHSEDTIVVKGVEANPQNRPLSISAGWNYIGYVGQRNLNVNDAFGAFGSKQNDLVKGQTNFAVYDSTLGWIGSLSVLMPGRGYQYYSHSDGILRYPRSAMFGKTNLTEKDLVSNFWKLSPYKYESNMNLIVSSNLCEEVQASGHVLLGAFDGNELLGFTKPQRVGDAYLYFLTVAGESGKSIQFRFLDDKTGDEYESSFESKFEASQVKGTIQKPILILSDKSIPCRIDSKLESGITLDAFPNPFQTETRLKIVLAEESELELSVIDLTGKRLHQQNLGKLPKGSQFTNLNFSSLSQGVYLVEVRSDKDVQKIKIIKAE